jgi:hypothetical protein
MLNQPREYLVVTSRFASFLVFVSWFCIIGSYSSWFVDKEIIKMLHGETNITFVITTMFAAVKYQKTLHIKFMCVCMTFIHNFTCTAPLVHQLAT